MKFKFSFRVKWPKRDMSVRGPEEIPETVFACLFAAGLLLTIIFLR